VTPITEGEIEKDSEVSRKSALKTHIESYAPPGCLIFQEIRTAESTTKAVGYAVRKSDA
jgi:hypothetical protein